MELLTRQQAVELTNEDAVRAVEQENCDFTNRVMDEWVEFSASVDTQDRSADQVTLIAYYYQTEQAVESCEQLDELDWEIEGYQVV